MPSSFPSASTRSPVRSARSLASPPARSTGICPTPRKKALLIRPFTPRPVKYSDLARNVTLRGSGSGPKKWSANDRWFQARMPGPSRGTLSAPSDQGRNKIARSGPRIALTTQYPMLTCSHVRGVTGSPRPDGLGCRALTPARLFRAGPGLRSFGVRSVVVACDDAGERRRERTAVMPVMPGAEPFFHSGGSTGVLLCHGFTGNPASLRPWAEYLAAAGLTVSLPRLPGHGTTWQDMAHTRWEDWYAEVDRAYEELRGRADEIFLMGLSMGACLALRMAELRGDGVAGLVLANPSLTADTKLFLLAPVLKLVVPSLKGIGSDIKKEGAHELSYDRVPVRAAATLPQLWKLTQGQLGEVTQPVLVYLSTTDHVVGPASMRVLRGALPGGQFTVRECANSYHVATLDNDAEQIFTGSLEFVRAHSHAGMEGGEVDAK